MSQDPAKLVLPAPAPCSKAPSPRHRILKPLTPREMQVRVVTAVVFWLVAILYVDTIPEHGLWTWPTGHDLWALLNVVHGAIFFLAAANCVLNELIWPRSPRIFLARFFLSLVFWTCFLKGFPPSMDSDPEFSRPIFLPVGFFNGEKGGSLPSPDPGPGFSLPIFLPDGCFISRSSDTISLDSASVTLPPFFIGKFSVGNFRRPVPSASFEWQVSLTSSIGKFRLQVPSTSSIGKFRLAS